MDVNVLFNRLSTENMSSQDRSRLVNDFDQLDELFVGNSFETVEDDTCEIRVVDQIRSHVIDRPALFPLRSLRDFEVQTYFTAY